MTRSVEHSRRHGPFDHRQLDVPGPAARQAVEEAEAIASGTVKWFNGPSGFGIIAADADGRELFVHLGSVVASGAMLEAGDSVEFEVHEGGMGAQAVAVRAVSTN